MALGFLLAIIAALCSATAAIVQSVGARRLAATAHVDPRLLFRLVRNGPYAIGLVLDGASSLLTFTALRILPVFAVQAVGAANLGMVAIIAMLVLRLHLTLRDWLAILGVIAGLVLLVLSAKAGPPGTVPGAAGWWLLALVILLGGVAYLGSPKMCGPAVPGLLAGLSFGSAALGARLLAKVESVGDVVGNPASYAVVLAGLTGVLLYATALQRGSVTVASASSVVGQTVAPAVTGWLLLGDRVRPGFTPVAILGFVLAVAGAVALARHAQPQIEPDDCGPEQSETPGR
ncbi:hypothetical protein E1211_13125 [Micromonospora sp. 15K316]|uniref:hypothetical protein n=1 Tax=Micromonospora sp. 15K316 TaxID=2530376 RepID=UPI0010493EDD|nr:hypothetical protein [Micromonospora sp. 15K316]TDC36557.1 hypothetical protein E1211_13125 [Micromonospora sp. 15K316]